MNIAFGSLDTAMPEQSLDRHQLSSFLVEESGKRTPEGVGGDFFRDLGLGCTSFEEPTDVFSFNLVASLIEKEIVLAGRV